jgi:hypothetical protein
MSMMEGDDGPRYLFWRDGFEGEAQGGMFYRSMKIGTFIADCEAKGYTMAGVVFDGSNNCEFLFVAPGAQE